MLILARKCWLEKAETFTSRTVVALGIYPALHLDEIPAQFLNFCGFTCSSLPRKGWNGQRLFQVSVPVPQQCSLSIFDRKNTVNDEDLETCKNWIRIRYENNGSRSDLANAENLHRLFSPLAVFPYLCIIYVAQHWLRVNPLTPWSDQYVNSPYIFNTVSSRLVMRMKKIIN